MPKKHDKPTGSVEGITFQAGTGKPELYRAVLPTKKDAIERLIVDAFLQSKAGAWWRVLQLVGPPEQNEENAFDFMLHARSGTSDLELMEIAPLAQYGGSYETVPGARTSGPLADAIWASISRKSQKYGRTKRAGLHLLLYSTDSLLALEEEVIALLQLWANTKEHSFERISHFMLLGPDSGDSRAITPVPDGLISHIQEFGEQRLRDSPCNQLRASWGAPTPDGRGWSISLGPAPGEQGDTDD